MECEIATMGERGQVVIPQTLRKDMGLHRGDKFMVLHRGDMLLLKTIHPPTKRENMLRTSHAHAKRHGITPADLAKVIRNVRRK